MACVSPSTAKPAGSVDDAIAAVVLARFGVEAQTNVIRQVEREWNSGERITWYTLAIKRGRLDSCHIVGRRRTRQELVELACTCQL